MLYPNKEDVLKHNSKQFVKDFRRLRSFITYNNSGFFKVLKSEVWKQAQDGKIDYYLSDEIYVVKRTSMVIV